MTRVVMYIIPSLVVASNPTAATNSHFEAFISEVAHYG